MDYDNITIMGTICRINDQIKNDNMTFFEVRRNRKYFKNGKEEFETSFFSAMIDNDILERYNDLFKLGSYVMVSGIPKSYIDKNGIKRFSIRVMKMESANDILEKNTENKTEPVIAYDVDGTMLWNGKRCESVPISKKEEDELKELLSKYE